jgi:hypothetical protein
MLSVLSILDEVPWNWSGGHVGRRLCDAMRTLRILPMPALAGYRVSWPLYAYEFDDLVGQERTAELEKTQKLRNRTRLLPSYRDITCMEAAISWPAAYLGPCERARAVNAVAFAHAIERDSGWVAAKRGGDPEFWRAEHDRGCCIIAVSLQRARVPVF